MHAHNNRTKQIHCPCFDCKNNIVWENTDVIKTHFIADYKVWIHHGEAQLTGNTCINNVNDEVHDADEDDDEDPGDHGMMHEGDLENDNGDHAATQVSMMICVLKKERNMILIRRKYCVILNRKCC